MTEYHIETLADLLDAAKRTEDLDGLFEDLRTWTELGTGFSDDSLVAWKPVFIWKDDGERGLNAIRLQVQEESA